MIIQTQLGNQSQTQGHDFSPNVLFIMEVCAVE